MPVLLDAIRPCNDPDTRVANGHNKTAFRLFLDAALKTVACHRASTRSQDLANQKLTILEFGKEQEIRVLLANNVSKASIAKILDVSRSALYHFIETRKIAPG